MKNAKPQTRPDAELNLRMPTPKAWAESVQGYDLSKEAETLLAKICADAVQDARAYQNFSRGRISRQERITRLERLRDVLLPLRTVISLEEKRLVDLLPIVVLEDLGRSFSLEGIRNAAGRAGLPEHIEELLADQSLFTIAAAEEFSAMPRADYGLARSDRLILFVIDTLLDSVERTLEMLKADTGGRPPLVIRRHFLRKIILAAPKLVPEREKPPTAEKLVGICSAVLPLFGVPARGIEKAVKAMVPELRQAETSRSGSDAL